MKYALAGHIISIQVSETAKTVNSVCSDATQFLDTILPSFIPFKTDDETAMASQPLMNLTIVDTLKEIKDARLIRDVDTGNGMTRVDRLSSGGYQFLVRDITGFPCASSTLWCVFLSITSCSIFVLYGAGARIWIPFSPFFTCLP